MDRKDFHICSRCSEIKPVGEFSKRTASKFSQAHTYCRLCRNAYMKDRRLLKHIKIQERETKQAYRKTVIGKARELTDNARRIIRKGIPFSITYLDVYPLLQIAVQSGSVTCKGHSPSTASIDRIVPSLGYVPGNVQIIPNWLNYAYHDYSKADVDKLICQWAATKGKLRERRSTETPRHSEV